VEENAAESVQQGSEGRYKKIWTRKQSKTRALGLEEVIRSRSPEENNSVKSGNDLNRSRKRWFPHLDAFQVTEGTTVSSVTVMGLLDPFLSEERRQRMETVVDNRTYSVPIVVEGLSDLGNISAVCRTADALGFQSYHVIANTHKLRYRENTRTSAGAEKWLDMERWDDTTTCFEALKARGFRIAVTHIAEDTVSIHDMDWTIPTAVVLGNEHKGITDEAIALSDVRCSIPMAGMVESFNVSVAAAIVMHHAVTDRIFRQGFHGDLSDEERSILMATFYIRHRDDTEDILKELVSRKTTRERPEWRELRV
jgi:tRNA G18 (ribose-2'-O)-methylase SpoU